MSATETLTKARNLVEALPSDEEIILRSRCYTYVEAQNAVLETAGWYEARASKLIDALECAMEALEKISKEQDYVESQSTGIKYYHDTEGSEISREALSRVAEILEGKCVSETYNQHAD
jgi:hypothetical protein